MPRRARRCDWAKFAIAACETVAVKRTSTSSGTKFPFTVAATAAGAPPPDAPPGAPPPAGGLGGGVITLTGPLGPVGNPTMIGGLCGQRGGWWRGGRSPLPGGTRARRVPRRCEADQFDLVTRCVRSVWNLFVELLK